MLPDRSQFLGRTWDPPRFSFRPSHLISPNPAPGHASTGSCVCILLEKNHSSWSFLCLLSFRSQKHPNVCPGILLLECWVFWEIQRTIFRNYFKSQLQSQLLSMVTSIRWQPFAPLWPPPSSGQHQEVSGLQLNSTINEGKTIVTIKLFVH